MRGIFYYLKKNSIFLLIILIGLLILTSACLSFYHNRVAAACQEAQAVSQAIDKATRDLLEQLQAIDSGVRGYGLTKRPELLSAYARAVEGIDVGFYPLDSLLSRQTYNYVAELGQVKRAFEAYANFTDQMVAFAKTDSMTSFVALLNQNEDYAVRKTWDRFTHELFTHQHAVLQQAQAKSALVAGINKFLQILLLITGIPMLGLVAYRIRQGNFNRRQLLLELDKNNRHYLFDPGTALVDQSSTALIKTSIQTFKAAHHFVSNISSGDYEVEWEGLNEHNAALNKDNLAAKLIEMREQMRKVKQKDEKQLWMTEGQAKFAEIVRLHQNSLATLSEQALIFLTKYLEAQQGSLFVLHHVAAESYLELTACYAFNRQKHLQKRILPGQGMVGQAYLEGQTASLTKVPQNYTYITSGLGDATPTCLLVVPAKYNDQVEAVIELAGFIEYEPHHIALVEKAGEILASTLISVKNNENMMSLLEESQFQGEQLRAQEEEMRQNMEELQATQEQQQRLERELRENEEKLRQQLVEIQQSKEILEQKEADLQLLNEKSLKRSQQYKVKMEALDIDLENKTAQINVLKKTNEELLQKLAHYESIKN